MLRSLPEIKAIKALGHTFANPTITKEPTCTETGIESGKCTQCNKQTTNIVEAKGHKIEKQTTTKEPTCTEDGKIEGICSVCGIKAEEVVTAKGHTYGEAIVTKKATENEEGLATQTCQICGDIKETIIPCISSGDQTTQNKDESQLDDGSNSKSNLIWASIAIISAIGIASVVSVIIVRKNKSNNLKQSKE